jgi:hypothetical protein
LKSRRADPLTVVSPASVKSWYSEFSRHDSPPVFIGEDNPNCEAIAQQVAKLAAGRPIRILSGHDSLIRDFIVGCKLREAGLDAVTQSGLACAVGVDKLLQKRLLQAAGIATPRWGHPIDSMPAGSGILQKQRDSTQSRGLGWAGKLAGATESGDAYWEEFVAGVEYSVVIFRDNVGTVTFPVVWKGENRLDLLPPWRRLRTVPSGLNAEFTESLTSTTAAIATMLDAWGFMEVEFIVPKAGDPLVIDINPRVCGTMRLVAMATGERIFDSATFPGNEDRVLPVHRFAAEIPFDGVPFIADHVIATSRLTCSGANAMAVRQVLAKWAGASPAGGFNEWPEGWHED